MLFEFDHYLVKRNTCSFYLGLPRFGSQSPESNRDRRKGEEKHQAILSQLQVNYVGEGTRGINPQEVEKNNFTVLQFVMHIRTGDQI